jgi:hypothetical protein
MAQFEAIVTCNSARSTGQTEFVQDWIHKVA